MTQQTTVAPGSSFTVPANITKVRATARGGAGSPGGNSTATPGRGGLVQAVLSVSPANVLSVARIAGGAAGARYSGSFWNGGVGGDGINIAGVLFGPGGGGLAGQSQQDNGGDGGLPNGGSPTNGDYHPGGTPAGGAQGDAGGTAGTFSNSNAAAGQSHSAGGAGGKGGTGSTSTAPGNGGGGGGGGYAGGGGGAGGGSGSPGAGGSGLGGDLVGYNSSTTADALFEVASTPLVPTLLAPIGNAYADRTSVITLAFAHNGASTDVLDAQTQADIRHRKVGTSTWTTVSSLGTATTYGIAANTYADGDQVEWQARTYADGLQGPWSDSALFTAKTPPDTPTITTPAASSTIGTAAIVAAWTHDGQVQYQARVVSDNSGTAGTLVYADTGAVTSTALTATLVVKVNEVDAHVQVRARDIAGGLWSQWADVTISISWEPPPMPEAYQRPDPEHGSIVIVITNPAPEGVQPAPTVNRIYITENDVEKDRVEIAPGTDWEYWTPVGEIAVRVEAVDESTGVSSSTEVIW